MKNIKIEKDIFFDSEINRLEEEEKTLKERLEKRKQEELKRNIIKQQKEKNKLLKSELSFWKRFKFW